MAHSTRSSEESHAASDGAVNAISGGVPSRSRPAVALGIFLLGRLLLWFRWLASDRGPGDVQYYFTSTQSLPMQGVTTTLVEYPAPVVWLLGTPQILAPGDPAKYLAVFVAMMLAADAAFTWALWRHTPRPLLAITVWSGFLVSMGTIVYLRFDVITAALVGVALLLLRHRPGLAGALVAVGAALKLWPAAVLLPMLAMPKRLRQAAGFAAAGGGLACLSLVLTGWERTASALTWQSDRGLQIESVWATPLMLARINGGDQEIVMSQYKAFEVAGSGVDQWMAWSSLAAVAGTIIIAALLVKGLTAAKHAAGAGIPSIDRLQWVALAVSAMTAVVIITNKTLSPQYLVWLAAPVVVAIALDARPGRRWTNTGLLLTLGLLTQLVYPIWYPSLWGGGAAEPETVRVTIALTARNATLLVTGCALVAEAWFGTTFPARYAGSRTSRR